MEENHKTKKEQQALTEADLERLQLLQQAHEKKGKQLAIGEGDASLKEIDELRQLVGRKLEDPEEKYDVYYKGIRKLLIDHLPKGKNYKEMRDIIYDEKNIFLNLGKRKSDNNGVRGSDGRMTFQPVMNEILEIVVSWVGGSQNPFAIYRDFYLLNEKHGYPHEEYDVSSKGVAEAMLKLGGDI